MRDRYSALSIAVAAIPVLAGTAAADIVPLSPVADAFVAGSQPGNNYGGAGALAVAAPGLENGEFQTLLRFDASDAAQAFNASYGNGLWVLESVTLSLTAASPLNPLFNASEAGQFGVVWMSRDDWAEGTGRPNLTSTVGVTFNDLPGLISAGDEELGAFEFDGSTSGGTVRDLLLTPGLSADIRAGGQVTFRLRPVGASVAMLVNSRNYPLIANRPVLTLTARAACYANCDGSTNAPVLTPNDFQCFLNAYAAGASTANCDGSTNTPQLTPNDFQCFLNKYAEGCSR